MTETTITRTVHGYRCDRCGEEEPELEAGGLEAGGLPPGWSSRPSPPRHFCYECYSLSGAWREDDD